MIHHGIRLLVSLVLILTGCAQDEPKWETLEIDGRTVPAWDWDRCGNYIYASQPDNFMVAIITPYTGLGGNFGVDQDLAVWTTHTQAGDFRVPFRKGYIMLVDETHAISQYRLPDGFVELFLNEVEHTDQPNRLTVLKRVAADKQAASVSDWLAPRQEYAPLSNTEVFKEWESETVTIDQAFGLQGKVNAKSTHDDR